MKVTTPGTPHIGKLTFYTNFDWLNPFFERFKKRSELDNLKKNKFKGRLILHFDEGEVKAVEKHEKLRPEEK